MNKLDKVETVREKTGVTYEEAREALDAWLHKFKPKWRKAA